MGPNGSFYGTTYGGGGGTGSGCQIYTGCGTVFELTPPSAPGGAWTESAIYSFQGGASGGGPAAPVIFGPDGVMYGTTSGGMGPCTSPGGIPGCGTVFALRSPAQAGEAWTEIPLYHFTGRNGDGMWPFAGLILGRNGALYTVDVADGLFLHVGGREEGRGCSAGAGGPAGQAGRRTSRSAFCACCWKSPTRW